MLKYRVKPGDTLQRVAQIHRVSVIDLQAINSPAAGGIPTVGQILNIPCAPLMKAQQVLPDALTMINAALTILQNPATADHPYVNDHFKLDKAAAAKAANLQFIISTYNSMATLFGNVTRAFREVDNDTAIAEGGPAMNNPGILAGGYSLPPRPIAFVSHYASLGPKARAAVMIHEGAHTVSNNRIGHGQGESGPAYVNETSASAILNAHCYANLAAAIGPATLAWDGVSDFDAAWRDTMFDPNRPWGLGRPNE